MGNTRERKDVLQMWDTRFSGWMPDFKLLVSHWISTAEKFKFEALSNYLSLPLLLCYSMPAQYY